MRSSESDLDSASPEAASPEVKSPEIASADAVPADAPTAEAPTAEAPVAEAPVAEAPPAEVEPSEAASPAGEELEGEGQKNLVGIMYSERKWRVPEWMKAAFLAMALTLVAGLVFMTVQKRLELLRLMMDSVVEPTPMPQVPAPDFSLPAGAGGPVQRLSELRGKWVLLNFWATWCPPCRDEMPSMEMLNRRLGDRLVMVAVTVDEDWGEVSRFFGDTAPSFRVLWDKEKTAARAYGTRKFPETYLIAPDGTVAAKFIGPRDWYNQGAVRYFEGVLEGTRDPT